MKEIKENDMEKAAGGLFAPDKADWDLVNISDSCGQFEASDLWANTTPPGRMPIRLYCSKCKHFHQVWNASRPDLGICDLKPPADISRYKYD